MRKVAVLVTALAAATALLSPAPAAGDPPHDGPVTVPSHSFPDPHVIKVGNRFYAYGTDGDLGEVQILSSLDLESWENVGDGLGDVPDFAEPDDVWAPAVLPVSGGYVLYSAYVQTDGGKRCIGITFANEPAGPFDAVSDTCFVEHDDEGGVIDPSVFTSGSGEHWLLWKTEGVVGRTPPAIWSQRLSADGRTRTGSPNRILISDQPWEGTLVENPFLVADGGRHFLFYSGNEWESDAYAVGWAACESPAGPCIKPPNRTLLHSEIPNLRGPGGGSVFQDGEGDWWFAFAAWIDEQTDEDTGERGLFLRRLQFIDGRPYLQRADLTFATSELTARVAGVNRYDTASAFSAYSVQASRPITYVATGATFHDALIAAPAAGAEASPVLLVERDSIPASVRTELARLAPGHIVVMGGADAISDAVYGQLRTFVATDGDIHREAGIDVYHRSALVSRNTHDPGVGVAFVATGAAFPDALAGGAAGTAQAGPLLFVEPSGIPFDVRVELERLQPQRIVVLGGPAAVSHEILAQLAQYSPRVDRVAGVTRYETAAALSAEFAKVSGAVPGVVIATGQNFPDALAAGAAGHPVLLVPSTGPAPQAVTDALAALDPLGVVVMGGTAAVSQETLASLGL